VKVIKMLMLLVEVGKDDANNMGNGENLIGQALVPYYRQILPVINIFVSGTGGFFSIVVHVKPETDSVFIFVFLESLGDSIDYGQQKNGNLPELCMQCLEEFELTGGSDAFINIKYLVPTYQSIHGSM
jgi:hypothetical protein